MAHQNRVTPFGELIAVPERGSLYGNRGCLVNGEGKIVREFKELRWIICVLDFKGRKHPMMAPGRYTGLFFLDEVTALAAGHRPCAECQRDRFNLFRKHWADANQTEAASTKPLAPVFDNVLHRERLATGNLCDSIYELPNGTFITPNGTDAYLVFKEQLLLWTPAGYIPVRKPNFAFPARILTPPSIVRALANGYPAKYHPSSGN